MRGNEKTSLNNVKFIVGAQKKGIGTGGSNEQEPRPGHRTKALSC